MVLVEQWRAFPRGAAGGNPCPLVTDARDLTAGQMQAVAAHYGHESAFVTGLSPTGVRLRYFVPRHEMRMCVHATIAAVTALISAGTLNAEHTTISTASGDHDATAVHEAKPDYPALWALCARLDTTGAYVFAPHPDGDPGHVVARQFPVDAGYPEDPATGVAAAALAAYLAGRHRPASPSWTRITIDQGDAMGQPSRLRAAALAGPGGVSSPSVTGHAIQAGRDQLDVALPGPGRPDPELR